MNRITPLSARLSKSGRSPFLLLAVSLLLVSFLLNAGSDGAAAQEPLEPAGPPDAHSGLPLFADRCANCHGAAAEGDGEMSDRLPKPPRDLTGDEFRRTAVPAVMFQTITEGILEGGMPPFGPASSNPLENAQRWNLVAAVLSLSTPAEAIENGRLIYEENCLACHGEDGQGDGPQASDSVQTPTDLTDLRYWYSRSNEMVMAGMPASAVSDHAYDLDEDELWDVIDYSRTFSYQFADPQAAAQPLESVTLAGQVLNGTTDQLITSGEVSLRAFTSDLQEAASLSTSIGPDGRFTFEVQDAGRDWVYMASIEQNDLSFSSNPQRVEGADAQLELPIVVFNTTTDPAAININQVHMIIDFVEDNVQISEIYVLSNLEPSVFVGETGNPDDGTLQFVLPAGAQNVDFQRSFRSFESFLPADEIITTEQGYADTVPVRPGDGAMNLLASYELPYEEGMTIGHPVFYETGNATIVMPDIGLELEGDGWTSEGVQQMGDVGPIRSYSRSALAPGEAISFSLQGSPQPAARVAGGGTPDNDLWAILLGGALLLLAAGGAVYTVQSWREEAQDVADDQDVQVSNLLNAIASLDEAYEAGNLEESVYHDRREESIRQLAALWPTSKA